MDPSNTNNPLNPPVNPAIPPATPLPSVSPVPAASTPAPEPSLWGVPGNPSAPLGPVAPVIPVPEAVSAPATFVPPLSANDGAPSINWPQSPVSEGLPVQPSPQLAQDWSAVGNPAPTWPPTSPAPTESIPVAGPTLNQAAPSWVLTSPETLAAASPAPQMPSPAPTESAPTDLSRLMGGDQLAISAQPETLVVPPPATEVNQVVTSQGSKGFPKIILLIGGLVLLLIVAGASAYFILGIGQEAPQASLPIEQQKLTTPPKVVIPTLPPNAAEENFGTLTGSATPSAAPTKAATSSAIDLLRQRGQ